MLCRVSMEWRVGLIEVERKGTRGRQRMSRLYSRAV